MRGLKNHISWRTFIVGFVIGYISAWGMHWATTMYTNSGYPVHERIPVLTP
jgi:multisubunit Na+/H+ antiporter MnhE subunit